MKNTLLLEMPKRCVDCNGILAFKPSLGVIRFCQMSIDGMCYYVKLFPFVIKYND